MISLDASKTTFDVNNGRFFAQNMQIYQKKRYERDLFFSKIFKKIIVFRQRAGSLKIWLFQCYEVFCVYNIDVICIIEAL